MLDCRHPWGDTEHQLRTLIHRGDIRRVIHAHRPLKYNNLGMSLVCLHFEVDWLHTPRDLPGAPGAILRLCPRLQALYFFAPCPTSICDSISPSLRELGVLIAQDRRLSAISDVDTIVQWSNDSSRRRNVWRLEVHWPRDNQIRRRDQHTLKESTLGVERFLGK